MINKLPILLFFCCFFSTNGQTLDTNKVPQSVRTKLHQLYPGIANIKWEKDNSRDSSMHYVFEVIAIRGKTDLSVRFDSTGKHFSSTESDRLDVPKQARLKFASICPDTTNTSWDIDNESGLGSNVHYVAYQSIKDIVKYEVGFDSNWQFDEAKINIFSKLKQYLPEAIFEYINNHYNGKWGVWYAEEFIGSGSLPSFISVRVKKKDSNYYYFVDFDLQGNYKATSKKSFIYPPDF